MEMIAMLNGLGRTPGPAYGYVPPGVNPNFDLYRYKLNGFGAAIPDATYDQIVAFLAAAKTDADFKDVLSSIEASGQLSEAQKADLKQKVADAQKPFYKKPLYWVGIAAVAYVGYRLYKGQPIIPSFNGLGAMITDPEDIRQFRSLTLLRALEMEVKFPGMQLVRGPSAYARIKREFGLKGSKKNVLEQFRRMVKGSSMAGFGAASRFRTSPKQKHWLFNWVGGGYNTVFANTKAEALRAARAMGKGDGMRMTLVPDPKSLRPYSSGDRTVKMFENWD